MMVKNHDGGKSEKKIVRVPNPLLQETPKVKPRFVTYAQTDFWTHSLNFLFDVLMNLVGWGPGVWTVILLLAS